MKLNLINKYVFVVCVLFLSAGVGRCSDANAPSDVNDANGPSVTLSYNSQKSLKNPFSSFMYFVPLISPTRVDVETSADNNQQVSTVSYKKNITSDSFDVVCEFEMSGRGFHIYKFNPPEVIASHKEGLKQGQKLENLIDYIKFDGAGIGSIEVKGTVSGNTKTVTEVDLKFNARGQKSTVTLGLYDVEPNNGQYNYENKSGEIIARVDTFIYKKTDVVPRMGIKIASVNSAVKPNGFWGGLKGAIANLILSPPKVAKLGNDTMLSFGAALLEEKLSFTFPKAKNIRKTNTAAKDNK